MKGSLENILNVAKIALASSLSALSLYAQQPFQIKTTDGNWNEKAPATLYFESTLGNIGTDPKKDPTKQFKSSVYFSGRMKSENSLEFFYTTTDIENPFLDAPTLDNTQTKIISFSENDTTAEINYQKAIMMDSKGKIRFEETVPKEKASSLLMKFGINLTDKADQSIRDYILLKTAGLLDVSIKESLTKYCENQTKENMNAAKENTGYELAINNIPLWTRDKNFAIRDKQIGWIMGISLSSKIKKEAPFALYYHLALKRENEQEKGTLNAYTETFTMLPKINQTQTCPTVESQTQDKPSSSLEGIWKAKGGDEYAVITKRGEIFTVSQPQIYGCMPIKTIQLSSPTQGSVYYERIVGRKVTLEKEQYATVKIKGGIDIEMQINGRPIGGYEKLTTLEYANTSPDTQTSAKITKPNKEEKVSPGLVDRIPAGNKQAIGNIGRFFKK